MSKMRVLVLGATGYIGRHIVNALAGSGWAEPIAAARRGATVTLDATDPKALSLAAAKVDAIINILSGPPDTFIKNAEALRTALDARPNTRLIHMSSMAAYGSIQGLVDEESPLLGDIGPYSAAKARAERLLHDCRANTVVFRPGCAYGNGSPQWSVRIAQLLRTHRLGDLGSTGDTCSNLVHVNDLVQAVLTALRTPHAEGQNYNLAMPHAPTWNEYFIAYARALKATPVSRIGARQLKLEARLIAPVLKIAEIACTQLKISTQHLPAYISPTLLQLWQHDIELSSEKATRELAMQWTPWKLALRHEA